MRVHRINVAGRIRFAGSRDDAVAIRQQMLDALEEKKLANQIEPCEVPTSKLALLPWLNSFIASLEAEVSFPDELPGT